MLVIGELINATRKKVRQAVIDHDLDFLQQLAKKQEEAGAHYIDVNVATGAGKQEKEIDDMKWAVQGLKEVTQKPLAIDTTSLEVMQAGLETHGPGAMVNSASAEAGRLEPFLQLAREYDCLCVALPVSDAGIPKDVAARLEISKQIVQAAEKEGFPLDRLYMDPLAFPLGVDDQSGTITLQTITALKEEFQVKTTIGLTNISHGLPQRGLLNRTFVTLAIYAGLDSAIMDPLDKGVMSSVLAAEAALGRDPYCGKLLKAFRKGQLVP